jgi:uncharacterized protein YxeA
MKKTLLIIVFLYAAILSSVFYYRNKGKDGIQILKEAKISVKYVNRFIWVLVGGKKYSIQE